MKNILIELTDSDDQKFIVNVIHILWIEPTKSGASIRIEDLSFPRKVKETYEQVRAIIRALDS